MAEGYCDGCKRRAFLTPLHGPEKGGPLRCYVCAGAWQAEHGQKRRIGRVVIRALKAFVDAGGSRRDVHSLTLAAMASSAVGAFLPDALGYMAEAAVEEGETITLTSELLTEILRLIHPDMHPPERSELATRATKQLLALQPFVFPAPKPKPDRADAAMHNASVDLPAWYFKKPSRPSYPCVDCAPTIPLNYCTACRAEFEKRCQEERERDAAKQREWYAQRKARRARWKRPALCAACGNEIKGKRKDARFCAAACRQRAHRKAVTDKNTQPASFEAAVTLAAGMNP
jgi:hypothetical protein